VTLVVIDGPEAFRDFLRRCDEAVVRAVHAAVVTAAAAMALPLEERRGCEVEVVVEAPGNEALSRWLEQFIAPLMAMLLAKPDEAREIATQLVLLAEFELERRGIAAYVSDVPESPETVH
jgi:hypothetical protein